MRAPLKSIQILLTLWISPLQAEYRAFELKITNSTTGQERTVIATLDPQQYRHYYPMRYEEQVTYTATWMCKGNTSNQRPVCPKPETGSGPSAPPAP